MAVIPNDGRVIVWDANANSTFTPGLTTAWQQRYSVGNPEPVGTATTGVFTNFTVQVPLGWGDMFCSGHVWLPDGRLFVAGGNTRYDNTPGAPFFVGSRLAAIWDPPSVTNPGGVWSWLAPMNKKRWYPTVTLIIDRFGKPRVMVSGGVETTLNTCQVPDGAFNTYEVFNCDPSVMNWELDQTQPQPYPPMLYNGPQGYSCNSAFGVYPRMFLASTNQVMMVGQWDGSNRVRHIDNPGTNPNQNWVAPWNNGAYRHYGSAVLWPNVGNTPGGRDLIMILGGWTGGVISTNTCQIIDGGADNPAWSYNSLHDMAIARMCANAVILPDGDVLAVGGTYNNYFNQGGVVSPVYSPEVFNKVTGWSSETFHVSPREYHSTAGLLPSGKVAVAGGDTRTHDWEVFTPRYLTQGQTQPAFAGTFGTVGFQTLNWDTVYPIEHAPLPVGVSISRVVLMRPCSVTHHSDMDQRYVELERVLTPKGQYAPLDTFTVRTPSAPTPNPTLNPLTGGNARGSTEALPGWYMAFLITSQGTPSVARWVKFLP